MARANESFLSHLRLHRVQRFGLLLSITTLLWTPWAPAAEQPFEVFHLGQFDSSSQEFHADLPDRAVRVSANDPAAVHNWYAFQPERPADNNAPPIAAQARTIAFQISGTGTRAPAADYRLHIALLIEHPGVPVLRVAVNGHTGSFFLHPKLVETGNDEAVFFPSFSRADLSIDIPGSYMHPGENEISFAAVPETQEPQAPEVGFHYDAISLEVAEETPAPAPQVRIEPTIFFRTTDGVLQEALDVVVRSNGLPAETAGLTVNGKQITLKLDPANAWGEQKQRIYVPAFDQPAQAAIAVTATGKTRRSTQSLQPAKRWTLYIVPHIHLDIGYTDYQAKVAALHSRAIDESLDMFAAHPDFRFSLDGMWPLEQFMNTRSPQDKERAIAALKAGQLFVPAEYCNLLTGFASSEVLIRSLYPSAAFDQQHGLPLNYANITDVPSFSWSYASVLAAAGIPELLAGSNNGRGAPLLQGHLDHSSPYWWEGPDGGRVLMWYSHHYHQMWTTFGLPPRMRSAEEVLPLFFQNYGGTHYKSNATIMYGTQVENSDLFPEQATFAGEWNSRYTYPHLAYSGFHQALSSIAADFKNDIPVIRGDGGPYWEDGIAADAFYGAIERETEARAPSAEKLATIAALVNPRIVVDKGRLDAMWKRMLLMDEHTWLSADSYTDSQNDQATVQLRVKDAYATEASGLADWLLRNNMANLADSIDTPAHSLVVFNTLSWPRGGRVSVDIHKGKEIVDAATGDTLPISVTDHGESTWRATFRAEDVPPVGYKTYLLRDAAATPPAPSKTSALKNDVLENEAYRVELDPASGAIRSIYDKSLRRDLVDATSPYRMGQYLYVTTEHRAGQADNYVVHPAASGRLVSIEKNAEGTTAHLESTDVNTPSIHTSIKLPAHGKTILIDAELEKKATLDDEAVYFAFPFAMMHPQFEYEIQNGVVDPARDMYPGAGHDWFSVQHWAAVQQDGAAAAVLPIDTPLMTFGDITRVTWPKEFGTRKGSIFSYAMNNYWHTNYRAAQGGHFHFRYILTSAPSIDPVALSRLGWEESTPLEVSEVTASDKAVEWKRPLDGKSGSFLKINDPALVLEAWKPAEDGRGTILRLLDLGGSPRTAHLQLPLAAVEHAWIDNALERDQSELSPGADQHSVEFAVKPHEIITLRVLQHAPAKPPCGPYCK